MGNGSGIRYRKQPEESGTADTWRKPKESKKGKETAKASTLTVGQDSRQSSKQRASEVESPALAPGGFPTASHLASAQAAEKSAASWQQPSWLAPEASEKSAARRAPPPVTSAFEDEDDDVDGFENLADAAAKVWEELMSQKHESKKDFNALFHLGELKDGVERAARRAESVQRQAGLLAAKADEKRLALEDACARIEERNRVPDGQAWKLGDMAIRRGKGLCEISTVHQNEDPPYFEVRMFGTGVIVGTESAKLVALTTAEQGSVRRALRVFEEAKTSATRAEEDANQANEELKQQHQRLTAQVEAAIKQSQESTPQAAMTSGFGGPKMAPPGLPDMNMVRKWTKAPKEIIPDLPSPAPAAAQSTPSASYPDMKGVKEDLRGSVGAEASGTPAVGNGATAATPTVNSSGSKASPCQPSGFPSFDDLKKSRQAKAKPTSQPASDYPSVHPSAARESFSRPSASAENMDASFQKPASQSRKPSMSGMGSQGQSVPSGFPTFESNEAASAEASRRSTDPGVAGPAGPSLGKRASTSAAEAAQAQREAQAQQQAWEQYQQQQAQHQAQQQAQQQQQQASSPQQAPAAEWVCYQTAEGSPYYHNERTNETVWVLPAGARARNPDGTPVGGQADGDDPFASLRQQEEQMRKEREYWAQWYAQYSAWYSQQGKQKSSAPSTEPSDFKEKSGSRQKQASPNTKSDAHATGSTSEGPAGSGYNPFHEESKQKPSASAPAPSRGPPPPRLLAPPPSEDRTIYAIKSAIMKEMEQMVGQVKPIAQRKKALRCLQIQWHPDKNPDKVDVSNSVFQFIEEAKSWFLFDPDAQDGS